MPKSPEQQQKDYDNFKVLSARVPNHFKEEVNEFIDKHDFSHGDKPVKSVHMFILYSLRYVIDNWERIIK